MNISDYLDAAQAAQHLPSRRALARHLECRPGVFSFWERRGGVPTDANICAVARAAGIPEEKALLDVAKWRAEQAEDEHSAKLWAKLAEELKSAAAVLVLGVGLLTLPAPTKAYAAQASQVTPPLYIMGNIVQAAGQLEAGPFVGP